MTQNNSDEVFWVNQTVNSFYPFIKDSHKALDSTFLLTNLKDKNICFVPVIVDNMPRIILKLVKTIKY